MRIGSLFSGAGGLDMAVEQVFGGHTVWHCEKDKAASKVLAARWPGVPNHHDITAVDWAQVEPVDMLCGGWPCQPFSLAGKRKGADDERALWPYVAGAVRMVRPRIVVLENVSAVLGPEFTRVANDLAANGYDIAWKCLRAADVGAPHRRERVFILAYAASDRLEGHDARASIAGSRSGRQRDAVRGAGTPHVTDTPRDGWDEGRPEPARLVGGPDAAQRGDGPVDLLPTPAAARSGNNQSPSPGAAVRPSLDSINDLLPTPTARDWKGGQSNQFDVNDAVRDLLPTPRTSDTNGAGAHGDGGLDLRTAVTLLQTPLVADALGGHLTRSGKRGDESLLPGQAREMATAWGKYAPAIRRWEQVTRPAPAPTEPNTKGNPRLSAAFSEWLMGWPAGWVTDIDISRHDQLRIIGNGVVPQQAVAALRWLLDAVKAAA